jgi:hypothetical protein
MNLYEYTKAECDRQGVGEADRVRMDIATRFLLDGESVKVLRLEDIVLILGNIVDLRNKNYRKVPVVFNQGDPAIPADQVPRQMELLLTNKDALTPDEFCKAFLDIHPFVDGNGRVASILYNWLKGNDTHHLEPLPYYYGGE